MKEFYPCPVCFTSGRVRTGIVERGRYGHMWHVEENQYECKCGSILYVIEKVIKE